MTQWIARTFALAAMALVGVACIASPEDSASLEDSEPADDLETASVFEETVAPGCFGDSTTCPAGTKTCSAWSAWSSCSGPFCASYEECNNVEIICGRGGCPPSPGTGNPQNRTRNCTMNVSGQACTVYDYRVPLTSCGC